MWCVRDADVRGSACVCVCGSFSAWVRVCVGICVCCVFVYDVCESVCNCFSVVCMCMSICTV